MGVTKPRKQYFYRVALLLKMYEAASTFFVATLERVALFSWVFLFLQDEHFILLLQKQQQRDGAFRICLLETNPLKSFAVPTLKFFLVTHTLYLSRSFFFFDCWYSQGFFFKIERHLSIRSRFMTVCV